MSTQFFWRLPTDGDARIGKLGLFDLNTARAIEAGYFPQADFVRQPSRNQLTYLDYLARVAKAAETAGFEGVLVPDSPQGEEPWIVAGALLRETRRLRFLASFHSAIVKPVHAARASATYQRTSDGRFDWNVLIGQHDAIQRRLGDFAPLADRIQRSSEFIDIARGVLSHREFDYVGQFYSVTKGGLQSPIGDVPLPSVYLSGGSGAAFDLAASRADVYVTWAEPVETLKPKIERLREQAAAQGRKIDVAVRVDLIVRPSEDEALEDARQFFESADRPAIRQRHKITGDDFDFAVDEHAYVSPFISSNHFDDTRISRNFVALEGLVRPGAAVTLVGDYAQAAAVLDSYRAAGVNQFFLASPPHLDEAYRVGEDLLPLLDRAPLLHAAE